MGRAAPKTVQYRLEDSIGSAPRETTVGSALVATTIRTTSIRERHLGEKNTSLGTCELDLPIPLRPDPRGKVSTQTTVTHSQLHLHSGSKTSLDHTAMPLRRGRQLTASMTQSTGASTKRHQPGTTIMTSHRPLRLRRLHPSKTERNSRKRSNDTHDTYTTNLFTTCRTIRFEDPALRNGTLPRSRATVCSPTCLSLYLMYCPRLLSRYDIAQQEWLMVRQTTGKETKYAGYEEQHGVRAGGYANVT